MANDTAIVGLVRESASVTVTLDEAAAIAAVRAPESFRVQFASWTPNNVHWEAPTHFIMYTTGDWYFFAAHLANMRRDNPLIDQGAPVHFKLNALYYDGPLDAAGHVTGVVLHSVEYYFTSLSYKNEARNFQTTGSDKTFFQLLRSGKIKSVLSQQKWTL